MPPKSNLNMDFLPSDVRTDQQQHITDLCNKVREDNWSQLKESTTVSVYSYQGQWWHEGKDPRTHITVWYTRLPKEPRWHIYTDGSVSKKPPKCACAEEDSDLSIDDGDEEIQEAATD
ncbi:hypothetical protein MVEN_00267000 [Mycena venus]|uniref:Uncharacterized protein n=1 Tax=Mycena venus TaxID=2733690 RepID=A0A8H6Z2C3_9AGAR|nr:hypothetical protein MVEN_00267000 [Mycena venus]